MKITNDVCCLITHSRICWHTQKMVDQVVNVIKVISLFTNFGGIWSHIKVYYKWCVKCSNYQFKQKKQCHLVFVSLLWLSDTPYRQPQTFYLHQLSIVRFYLLKMFTFYENISIPCWFMCCFPIRVEKDSIGKNHVR